MSIEIALYRLRDSHNCQRGKRATHLKAEELAIKGLEVWIAVNGAGASGLQTLGTTLACGHLEFLVGATLDRRAAHLGAAYGAAVAATTATGSHVPGLVVLIDASLVRALAAHLGHNATGTAAVLLLKLWGALQDRASGALANRGAIQAGAVGASIRRELHLIVVQLLVEDALATCGGS